MLLMQRSFQSKVTFTFPVSSLKLTLPSQSRVTLQKAPSIRQTFESVGTSIRVIQRKYAGTGYAPTPEELKNYMDV